MDGTIDLVYTVSGLPQIPDAARVLYGIGKGFNKGEILTITEFLSRQAYRLRLTVIKIRRDGESNPENKQGISGITW